MFRHQFIDKKIISVAFSLLFFDFFYAKLILKNKDYVAIGYYYWKIEKIFHIL